MEASSITLECEASDLPEAFPRAHFALRRAIENREAYGR